MCGRYVLMTPVEELGHYFGAHYDPDLLSLAPSWNIPPTSDILTVRSDLSGRREMSPLRWGLIPPWAKDLNYGSKTVNARAETIATKPSFRAAFRSKRCIIPADGYFEWKTTVGEVRQPHYFRRSDGKPLAFAGLWEHWEAPETSTHAPKTVTSCAIVTTSASNDTEGIHHRMPVILSGEESFERWLDGRVNDREELLRLCVPAPSGTLTCTRVSHAVNSVKNNGPKLIAELSSRTSLF